MKIEHVAIWAKDIDKVCDFYRKYFGGVVQPLYHNPTKQFTSRFITFDDGAIRELAREAIKRKTGARGLRAIMEQLMTELMFEAPGRRQVAEIAVTADLVRSQLKDPSTLLRFLGTAEETKK